MTANTRQGCWRHRDTVTADPGMKLLVGITQWNISKVCRMHTFYCVVTTPKPNSWVNKSTMQ